MQMCMHTQTLAGHVRSELRINEKIKRRKVEDHQHKGDSSWKDEIGVLRA